MERSRPVDQFWRTAGRRRQWVAVAIAILASFIALSGCETPSAHTLTRSDSLRPDLPVDPPRHENTLDQDCIEGGRLYKYYCGSCHNARPLGERPFSNYHVAVTHMRSQAYLTGQEYRQIIVFLRRWQDLGTATPPVNPSPKRMIFSQPISELRKEAGASAPAPPPESAGPFQKPLGAAPPPLPEPPGAGGPPAPRPDANLPAPIN
jgi:hypothetical protein